MTAAPAKPRIPNVLAGRYASAELATLWTKWKLSVLYDAGTLHKGLLQQYEALGRVLIQPHFTPADRETIALMQEAILAKVDVLIGIQPAAPTPEEALLHRLTEAHAEAARMRAATGPLRDPEAETPNPPTPES